MNREVRVGILGMVAILVLLIGVYGFHHMSWGEEKGMTFRVVMSSSRGLSAGSSVRYAGVNVGQVTAVTLADHRAVVTVKTKKADIPKNAHYEVAKDGILGTYYLRITGGDGALVSSGEDVLALGDGKWEKMTDKAKKLVETLKETRKHVNELSY